MPHTFETRPCGPFDLAYEREHFGWEPFAPDPDALAMAFPVEGWAAAAAVVVRQPGDGIITGTVHGSEDDVAAQAAWQQALAVLSLDVDGTDFPAVGERDPVIGRLQRQHHHMRPTLFHSPYEAACNFVIGQRISIAQARALRQRMARDHGRAIEVDGATLAAFPGPARLLGVDTVAGLPAEKLVRLHGVARAALDGVLDRDRLRSLGVQTALDELMALHGVGPFSAQGILFRGAGVVDAVTDDPVTKQAVQRLYDMDHLPEHPEVVRMAEPWRPFRMWSLVLLHVWLRGEGGGPAPARRDRSSRRG